ncbi:MAG: tRNA uridine-5-carboxymethylaminomethyl(34) synthesis enzyme MnmG, partial [Ktedonobacterales bacterium]|nr:tRNA uridine-5-carboxymethylaminomethyl(34) synthesis enzyme MnmG [Ktedonobacterales bacterium]
AYTLGLISEERYARVERRRALAAAALDRLGEIAVTPARGVNAGAEAVGLATITQQTTALELLRRPEARYWQVRALIARATARDDDDAAPPSAEALPELDEETTTEVELRAKYAGYIRKEEASVRRALQLERSLLPTELRYTAIGGLRHEARQQLERVRPRTVGQAARIPGVTPADIAILLIQVERLRRAPRGRAPRGV